MTIHCDICEAPAIYECQCRRCAREPEVEERYHACSAHTDEVAQKHWQVRQRDVVWMELMSAALLIERINLLQSALSDIEAHADVRGGAWAAMRAFTARNEYREMCEKQKRSKKTP